MTRVALDSNVLVYAAGVIRNPSDRAKVALALDLLIHLGRTAKPIAPIQALGETFVVMRRSSVPAARCREVVLEFASTFETPASEARTLFSALDLAVDHKLQHWDAMILSAAADAGCSILLSEDMQHGFVVRGVTVINPFADEVHPKLAELLT